MEGASQTSITISQVLQRTETETTIVVQQTSGLSPATPLPAHQRPRVRAMPHPLLPTQMRATDVQQRPMRAPTIAPQFIRAQTLPQQRTGVKPGPMGEVMPQPMMIPVTVPISYRPIKQRPVRVAAAHVPRFTQEQPIPRPPVRLMPRYMDEAMPQPTMTYAPAPTSFVRQRPVMKPAGPMPQTRMGRAVPLPITRPAAPVPMVRTVPYVLMSPMPRPVARSVPYPVTRMVQSPLPHIQRVAARPGLPLYRKVPIKISTRTTPERKIPIPIRHTQQGLTSPVLQSPMLRAVPQPFTRPLRSPMAGAVPMRTRQRAPQILQERTSPPLMVRTPPRPTTGLRFQQRPASAMPHPSMVRSPPRHLTRLGMTGAVPRQEITVRIPVPRPRRSAYASMPTAVPGMHRSPVARPRALTMPRQLITPMARPMSQPTRRMMPRPTPGFTRTAARPRLPVYVQRRPVPTAPLRSSDRNMPMALPLISETSETKTTSSVSITNTRVKYIARPW